MLGERKGRWGRNVVIGFAVAGICWTGLFSVSAFLSVYDDHQNLVGAAHRIKGTLNAQVMNEHEQLVTTRLDCARREGENDTLQAQNRSQQNTINSCLTQAIKLLSPEPLTITSHFLGAVSTEMHPKSKQRYGTFLVLTNRTVTPVRLLVTCEADITAGGHVLGTGAMTGGGWGGKVTSSSKQYGIGILSPAWTPRNPLLVTVFSDAENLGNCKFDEQ